MYLNVNEIFTSIDGEVNAFGQGGVSTFIRLAGCNLRCRWCDTVRAQIKESGSEMMVSDIVQEIVSSGIKKVTITGGEPLIQIGSVTYLVNRLIQERIKISIETNGTISAANIRRVWVSLIVDYKLPSSDMTNRMNPSAFKNLNVCDFVKFGVVDRKDYESAKSISGFIHSMSPNVNFAYSPVMTDRNIAFPNTLANWMIEDKLDAIFSYQLHKILGVA